MNRRDGFERAIDAALAAGDPDLLAAARLAYAFWLEGRRAGDDARLARAQRWMAEGGRCPGRAPPSPRWLWRRESRPADPDPAALPGPVFDALGAVLLEPGGQAAREYPTRRLAEWDLALALAAGAGGGGG
jgi:hypothetical protein